MIGRIFPLISGEAIPSNLRHPDVAAASRVPQLGKVGEKFPVVHESTVRMYRNGIDNRIRKAAHQTRAKARRRASDGSCGRILFAHDLRSHRKETAVVRRPSRIHRPGKVGFVAYFPCRNAPTVAAHRLAQRIAIPFGEIRIGFRGALA